MTINEKHLTESIIVSCMDCEHRFDWAEVLGPCPECGGTVGSYKNRPVGLKTGHEANSPNQTAETDGNPNA